MSGDRRIRFVFSLLFWGYLGLSSAALFPIAAAIWATTRPFDPRLRALHRFTSWWGYHYMQAVPWWRVKIEQRRRICDVRPSIIVANHQSLADILVLFGLRRHFKWVSKASVFLVPFIGWNMWLNRYVGLRRGNTRSIAQMMDECRAHLRGGSSVFMFPEGTRSPDGEIQPFLAGAFVLACEQQVPIIPIIIDGTADVLPKHGLWFRGRLDRRVAVRVLAPIGPSPSLRPGQLRKLVRDRMSSALAEQRGATPMADPARSAA